VNGRLGIDYGRQARLHKGVSKRQPLDDLLAEGLRAAPFFVVNRGGEQRARGIRFQLRLLHEHAVAAAVVLLQLRGKDRQDFRLQVAEIRVQVDVHGLTVCGHVTAQRDRHRLISYREGRPQHGDFELEIGRRGRECHGQVYRQLDQTHLVPVDAGRHREVSPKRLCYTSAMSTVERHTPGSFCWVELGTTDQPAAKTFYTSLFGWDVNDNPMGGPGGVYSMFTLGGRNVAGGYTLMPDMIAQGIPPHWMLYVQVENADDTAAKVTASGGKVMGGPFDVMTFGRMAVLQDPTGAVFSVWQPKSHPGIQVAGEPGVLCWADLSTGDVAAAKKFYEAVFGWQISPGEKDTSGYLHVKNGEHFIGGVPPAEYRDPKAPPHWLLYFQVAKCDASTAKAKELGARVYVEPMTMENVGRWSVVADPQGAVFSLFEAAQHA